MQGTQLPEGLGLISWRLPLANLQLWHMGTWLSAGGPWHSQAGCPEETKEEERAAMPNDGGQLVALATWLPFKAEA